MLMKYTLLVSESEFAPIFQTIVSRSRNMEFAILQSGYDSLAFTAAATTNSPLVTTKYLAIIIVNLILWSGDLDCLDEDCSMFRTIYSNTAKASRDLSNIQTYDLLSNNMTITLEEVRLF